MPNQQHTPAHQQGTISCIQPLPPPCEPVRSTSGCTDQHWEELAPMSHTRCSIQAHTCGDNGSMQDQHPDVHTPMRLHKDQPACMNRLNHTSHTQCVHTAGQQHADTLCDMPKALQHHAPTRAARHVTCGPHPTPYLFITPPQLGHHTQDKTRQVFTLVPDDPGPPSPGPQQPLTGPNPDSNGRSQQPPHHTTTWPIATSSTPIFSLSGS